MTRSLNVTPKTTLRSSKSEALVTIIEDSRGLSATAELLVVYAFQANEQTTKQTI